MFLQCQKEIMLVPKSSDTSLIFPFNDFRCRFQMNMKKITVVDSCMPIPKIQQSLRAINASCDNFTKLKQYRNAFWLLIILLIAGIITGGGLINSGISKEPRPTNGNQVISDTTNIIRFANGKIIAGAVIIGVSVIVFTVLMILIVRRVRRLRIIYEKAVFETIKELNKDLKGLEIRWKIGLYLRWVEISFDHKKRSFLETKKDEGSRPQTMNELEPTNVQLSIH